ncbi:hypothetical protein [Chlorobium sp. KB01]|uniref:hypothetical protein n=1 Tax=Chlorobium sp. KB01 TaxID=1917528 RepID=UPI000976EAB2|nr:hypothetical protein [Chlorobium sp. KB01]
MSAFSSEKWTLFICIIPQNNEIATVTGRYEKPELFAGNIFGTGVDALHAEKLKQTTIPKGATP